MGQIVSKAAKPKRCNVLALKGSLANVVLDNGEHMLVSTDNSMGANGQGNFTGYVVGDGVTKCGALPLHSIDDAKPSQGEGDVLAGSETKYWINAKSDDPNYGQQVSHTDASYSVTDYIDVSQFYAISIYALYHCWAEGIYNKGGYCWYNENKEVIGGAVIITAGSFESKWFENIPVPVGAKYIRYTFATNNANNYVFFGNSQILTKSSVVNNLTEGGADVPLSAEQGVALAGLLPSQAIDVTMERGTAVQWLNADSEDADFGNVINASGSGYCVSQPIQLRSIYTSMRVDAVTGTGNSAMLDKSGIVFYNSDNTPIQGVITATTSGFKHAFMDVQIPTGAAYFRMSSNTTCSGVVTFTVAIRENYLLKTDIVNNLDDGGEDVPLSAEMGKELNEGQTCITDIYTNNDFGGATQDAAEITCEKNANDEWVITKHGSTGYRLAGLTLGVIPANIEYRWDIEYSSTSTTNTAMRLAKTMSAQAENSGTIATFRANANHDVISFNRTREAYTCLGVSSTHMSNTSSITIHSIRVYRELSVQQLGDILMQVASGVVDKYGNVTSLFADRKEKRDLMRGNANFSCFLFSDIHGDATELARILTLYNDWSDKLDVVINVGDTITESSSESNTWYWNAVDNMADGNVLLALGNHDVWRTGDYDEKVDKVEYDAWILPLSSRISGLVKPANADTLLLPYYYKDYGNIRVIVLSTYTDKADDDLAWFVSALTDAITNNKKVIVVNHIAHAACSITGNKSQFLDDEMNYNNGFRSYSSLYGSGSQGTLPDSFVSAVTDFINDGGTFITWIFGHLHWDFFTDLTGTSYVDTYGKQAMIGLTTARSSYQNDNCKQYPDGTGMDGFYMLSVNENNGTFSIMKFGGNMDFAMRERITYTYDYVGKKLVALN